MTGTIKLIDGTFKAYGQDLVINKGNLTFAGPVNKPILDFEAIRNPDAIEDNVTAGIRIKGPSDAPQTELFYGSGHVPSRRHLLHHAWSRTANVQ